jgi:hypothetical protein
MSVSTEVQRTLVKSPPELWSELSNPTALARHLAKLGEIRITDIEPETKVEWEAEGATGVVHLKQSGWGTKVTLSVTRVPPEPEQVPEPEPLAVESEPVAVEPESEPAAVESEPVAVEPEPEPAAVEPESPAPQPVAVVPEPELEPVEEKHELEPIAEPEPEPELQLGFFARLFRRRGPKRAAAVAGRSEPELIAEVEPEPDFEALAAPDLIYVTQPTKAAVDLAAELAAVEEQMAQETTELLTSVLDRLGAAHHRPFSRG